MTASLRFLSHLRTGLAATLSGAATAPQALAGYSLTVSGVALAGDYRLFGPGQVLGLDVVEVLRSFPPGDSRDHEPNLFAHVELRSADLPWRYTPGGPIGGKLRPWLVLVVVDAACATLEPRGSALPVLKTPASELPPLADAWAWAHVQLTLDGASTTDIQALYETEPERFLARLLCPRQLDPRRRYLACVVPAYDVGRDAGLGLDISGSTMLNDAWTGADGEVALPVYHSWSFSCGSRGDFEFLAEQLQPGAAPADLGVAQLDSSAPGLGLPGVKTPVRMLGALCAPQALQALSDPPAAAETALRDALWTVVQDSATAPRAAGPKDPVLGPPCYGATQAGLVAGAPWQQTLNREPGWRAVAGLGADLVRAHQEDLAASAWQQLEAVAGLQRSLRRDALKEAASQRRRQRLAGLTIGQAGAYLVFARPACATTQVQGKSVLQRLRDETDVPAEAASAATARLAVRTGGAWRKRGSTAASAADVTGLCMDPATRPDFAPQPGPAGRCLTSHMQPVSTAGLKTLAAFGNAQEGDAALQAQHPGKSSSAAPAVTGFRGGAGLGNALWDATEPTSFLRERRRSAVAADASLGLGVEGPLPTRLQPSLSFPTPFGSMLARKSPEFILPGAGRLPNNSVVALAVNAGFIEACLVGVNGEWGHELVWREMPANPRATAMRRFWDSTDSGDQIPAIGQWNKNAALGGNATALAGNTGIALVIKGRLLERHPQTQVYALRAGWAPGERVPIDEPTQQQLLWPDVSSELSPGVHFVIFTKLSLAQARGTDLAGVNLAAPGKADPGWYFVLEEQAAAPRFGLDVPPKGQPASQPERWDELNWAQVTTTGAESRHVGLNPPRGVRTLEGVTWAAGGAEMAWITLQTPFRMCIHASSLLGPAAPAKPAGKKRSKS